MSVEATQNEKKNYSDEELSLLKSHLVPKHVAIIMDGNRRWAEKKSFQVPFFSSGHQAGATKLIETVEAAQQLGVKILTVYAFSTENWSRAPGEVNFLLKLFETTLLEQSERMREEGVKFDVIGNLDPLPSGLRKMIDRVKKRTEDGTKIELVVAFNYGGRDEIVRAMRKLGASLLKGEMAVESLSEESVEKVLDTYKWGYPDLLIRTSGEMRISNFLLWQLAYAEIYVTPTLWPDFSPQELLKAVLCFQDRQRRMGK